MNPEERRDILRQLALSIADDRQGCETMRVPRAAALLAAAIEEIRKEMEKS